MSKISKKRIFCRKKTAGGIVLNLKQGLGAAARPAAAAARPHFPHPPMTKRLGSGKKSSILNLF